MKTKQQQEERREQWRKRVREQETTTQPIRAFCRERGLKEPMFYAWRQRLRAENKPVSFALIETKLTAEAAAPQPVELVLAGGDRLRIPSEAATLRLVLSVLREQRA
jgi:hypothetical protein